MNIEIKKRQPRSEELFNLEPLMPTSKLQKLFEKLSQDTKPDKKSKLKNMELYINSLKQMNFMHFHKEKKPNLARIDTHDIRENKQLTEMFQPFYNLQKQQGSMKNFFFHNRYRFEDFPEHLNKFEIYDPNYRVNSMLEYRNQTLKLKSTSASTTNGNSPSLPNMGRKVNQSFIYNEEIDDYYCYFRKFEKEARKKRTKDEPPSQIESAAPAIPKVRKSMSSFRLSLDNSGGHKIKLCAKSEVTPNQIKIEGEEISSTERNGLMLEFLKSEFNKNLTFKQQTLTEDFLEELQDRVSFSKSDSLIPLIEMKERRYFELFQMRDPQSLVIYRISDDGTIEGCAKYSELSEFTHLEKIKHRPFYLFLFYHAFLLFENNWSFIYNLLLKNPMFSNIEINFSNMISGINLTKFLLGEQFYETTKRPISNTLTKQLFRILSKSAQLKRRMNKIYPKKPMNIRELDCFNMSSGFYADEFRADFNRESYLKEYCKIEEDVKDVRIMGIKTENTNTQFPTPSVKKGMKNEPIKEEENESNFPKTSLGDFNGEFGRSKNNQEKFRLFCSTIQKSNRVDYETYMKDSKKQMFYYKLRKFKGYKDKKMGKIKSLAKKFKNKSMGFYLLI